MYMHNWFTLLYTWNYHHIVNQLYSNKNNFFKLLIWCFLVFHSCLWTFCHICFSSNLPNLAMYQLLIKLVINVYIMSVVQRVVFNNHLFLKFIQCLETWTKVTIYKLRNKWIDKSEMSWYALSGMLDLSRNQLFRNNRPCLRNGKLG